MAHGLFSRRAVYGNQGLCTNMETLTDLVEVDDGKLVIYGECREKLWKFKTFVN